VVINGMKTTFKHCADHATHQKLPNKVKKFTLINLIDSTNLHK